MLAVRKTSSSRAARAAAKTPRPADLPVDLVRSRRRRRTYKWSVEGGRVRLEIPSGLPPADETRIVTDVIRRAGRRLARAALPGDAALMARGRALARQYVPG